MCSEGQEKKRPKTLASYYEFLLAMAHKLQPDSVYLTLSKQNNTHFKINVDDCKYNMKDKKNLARPTS